MSEGWHQCNPWTLSFDTEGSIFGQYSSSNPDMVRWVTGVPRNTNPLTPKPKHKMRLIICFSEKIHWLKTVSSRVTVLSKYENKVGWVYRLSYYLHQMHIVCKSEYLFRQSLPKLVCLRELDTLGILVSWYRGGQSYGWDGATIRW